MDVSPLGVRSLDGAAWVGARYEPDRVTPGETTTVTLSVYELLVVVGTASSAAGGLGSVSEFVPGGAIDVTLYWEAQGDMGGATEAYFVFVHLLDAGGQLAAQHDGPPVGGRYPPAAWIPGEPVPDLHTLFLDSALPAGMYTLQAGVYTWPTFERLPAWDASGNRMPDDAIRLGGITIR